MNFAAQRMPAGMGDFHLDPLPRIQLAAGLKMNNMIGWRASFEFVAGAPLNHNINYFSYIFTVALIADFILKRLKTLKTRTFHILGHLVVKGG